MGNMAKLASVVAAAAAIQSAQAYVAPGAAVPRAMAPPQVFGEQSFAEVYEEEVYQGQSQSSSWSPFAFGAALGLAAAVLTANAPTASAADVENGGSIFGANCTACHAGGKNNVKAEKTLFPDALKANNRYENADMIAWITSGGNGMPAFGERLGPDDIEDVAAYVRGQADKGW